MNKNSNYLIFLRSKATAFFAMAFLFAIFLFACTTKEKDAVGDLPDIALSESDFRTVPDPAKPWVYYWWLKGNVTKEQITRDLEGMHEKGIGGFLLFDSRRYWDSFDGHTGHIPVPLQIKHGFMSQGWREMVKHAMKEADRLGLKMSINLADTGGSLRGPWDMKEDRPKQLIWTATNVSGPTKFSAKLEIPPDREYFHDVALMAVKIKPGGKHAEKTANLNQGWKTVSAPGENSPVAGEVIKLENKVNNGSLRWDVPEGEWKIIRFGYHIIGEEGSVDILDPESVTKYFNLMGAELLKDADTLAGVTLTHFYNVSWEGGQPDWTVNFEDYFKKYSGYDIYRYMPVMAGMSLGDKQINERFMRDYLRSVSDCFKHNCYETIGSLCHAQGVKWHSEDGGPWPREAPMFREADQLTFWGRNDMPQGEFWCSDMTDLHTKSNMRYAAMAGHIYGHPLVAVEAFTHMGLHWTKYPAYLKPFADVNLIDGANFFIWHTFTSSPIEIGKPGYEYFAGTHINTNITWWEQSVGIFAYLGRCQYMLRKGKSVADVCCYVSDKNYVRWGRGEKWNANSRLTLPKGYAYDLLSSEVLLNRLSAKNGCLVLPDGTKYKMLVVDLEEPVVPVAVLRRMKELANEGATVVLGETKPLCSANIANYNETDKEISALADELWGKNNGQAIGKGKIFTATSMPEVLEANNILPDFEGPFEYIHRSGGNSDIYFVSGEGKAECTFRAKGKKPEIWDPVSGNTTDALSYKPTGDGRTSLSLELPQNGSAFIVFREKAEKGHFVSIDGPGLPVSGEEGGTSNFVFWKDGDYTFKKTNGKAKMVSIDVAPALEIGGKWDVTFVPATGAKAFDATFDNLALWNEDPDDAIKYFSGTATYTNYFTLNPGQSQSPARLNLGEVHDVAGVWVNGKNMGIVWTTPWSVDLTGVLKEGKNELKIEVTNCWANRMIGDAGLPESQWTTKTNVRRVPDRSKYKRGHQAFAASDELMPSGLAGPVDIEFGEISNVGL